MSKIILDVSSDNSVFKSGKIATDCFNAFKSLPLI